MDRQEKTYEMLWSCSYCDTRKLLGKTHRHCPNCGAAQDPASRYFPDEADKVAVEDHVFVGADRVCASCGEASSARAKHCGGCGAPLESAREVVRREDGQPAIPPSARAETDTPTRRKRGRLIAVGVTLAAIVAAIVIALTWKEQAALTVSGHSWSREIKLEVFATVSDSAWCDALPAGAFDVSRSREVRSHNKIPDGEDCRTKRVDNGDGTFTEKRICEPRYRDEPVYDERCRFRINRWTAGRTVSATGRSLAENPGWPAVALQATGQCLGCEREGGRGEKYTVHFRDQAATPRGCDLDQARWATFAVGSRWQGEVAVLTGLLDCDTLRPAR